MSGISKHKRAASCAVTDFSSSSKTTDTFSKNKVSKVTKLILFSFEEQKFSFASLQSLKTSRFFSSRKGIYQCLKCTSLCAMQNEPLLATIAKQIVDSSLRNAVNQGVNDHNSQQQTRISSVNFTGIK